MVDTKQQQQQRQHSLREVVFLKKKVGTDPRHSDLIQELNVLEAAMAEESRFRVLVINFNKILVGTCC